MWIKVVQPVTEISPKTKSWLKNSSIQVATKFQILKFCNPPIYRPYHVKIEPKSNFFTKICRSLRHPNFMQLLGLCSYPVCMVMNPTQEDLDHFIKSSPDKIDWILQLKIAIGKTS